jgi:hypothetical protein
LNTPCNPYSSFFEDEDDIKRTLDAAASELDGSWYYSNSRDGPMLSTADGAKPGHVSESAAARAAASADASGMLVVFRCVQAANAKAAELCAQEAKLVPTECELSDDAGSTAGTAAVAATQQDVGVGRCRWQVEQQLRVVSFHLISCVAVGKITVEVVPVAVEG